MLTVGGIIFNITNMLSKTKQVTSIDAVVFPPCKHCGKAYKPETPIRDYGTVVFKSTDRIANFLYKLEVLIKNLRIKRLGAL